MILLDYIYNFIYNFFNPPHQNSLEQKLNTEIYLYDIYKCDEY